MYRNSVESGKAPFVISCRVLNANPRTNDYFVAFVIGERAVLENWFIHLATLTNIGMLCIQELFFRWVGGLLETL